MAVKITQEDYDILTSNGFTEDDIQYTINNYRQQGKSDDEIYSNISSKIKSLPQYNDILQNENLTKEEKALQISQRGEKERKNIEKEYSKDIQREILGTALSGASFAPIFNVPVVGTALGGGLYELGQGITEGQKPLDIAKRTAKGAAIGATVDAALFGLGRTPVGKAIKTKTGEFISKNASKVANSRFAKRLKNVLSKTDDNAEKVVTGEVLDPKVAEEMALTSKPQTDVIEDVSTTIKPVEEPYKKDAGLAKSIIDDSSASEEIKQGLIDKNLQYNPISNVESINAAKEAIEKDFNGQVTRLATKKELGNVDYEIARQLVKTLSNSGRNEEALSIIENVSKNATEKGREIQLLSLWSNLSPEGAVYRTQKIIKEYNKKNPKNPIKLTAQKEKEIFDAQQKALDMPEGYEKQVELAKVARMSQEDIPVSKAKKLKTVRNIAMLLNPKTLERNLGGNVIFNSIDTLSKSLAVPIDAIMSLSTKQRTRVLPQLGSMLEGARTGLGRGMYEVGHNIDTRGLGQRYDLSQGRTFANSYNPIEKGFDKLEKALDYSLRVPDRIQYETTFAESVANQLKSKKVKLTGEQIDLVSKIKSKHPVQYTTDLNAAQIRELIDTNNINSNVLSTAEQEALESVFQNNSELSQRVLALRRELNKVGTEDFGLGDLMIPYAQTPANLTQQAINYSPLGAIKAYMNRDNQRQASLDLARALVGSSIIGGSAYGANKGFISPNEYDPNYQTNTRLKGNMRLLGQAPNSIGGMWYSPFQPISTNIAVGAAMANDENPLSAGLNTIIDVPYLQQINRFVSDTKDRGAWEAFINMFANTPSQFVPTALGQLATAIDPYQKETYSSNKIKQGLNMAQSKIPYLRSKLPNRRNLKGEDISAVGDNEGLNAIRAAFIDPTYVNKPKKDEVVEEMFRLQQETKNITNKRGNISQYLPIPDKQFIKEMNMDNVYLSEYQRALGDTMYKYIEDLMSTEDYQMSDNEDKIKMIEKVKKDVNKSVKEYMVDYMKNN